MAVPRTLFVAAAVGAFGVGLGFFTAPTDEFGDPPADAASERIRRALVADTRLEQSRLLVPVLENMQDLRDDDIDALAAVFEEAFPAGGRGLPLELFVARWARDDPQTSRTRIASWPADVRRDAWPAWIGSRARIDPAAAVAVLEAIPDASVRRRCRPALIDGWSASGDPGVWRYLAEIGDPRTRGELGEAALRQRLWLNGADALIREIEALPAEPPLDRFAGELLAAAAGILASDDLPAATALAEAHREDPYGGEITARLAVRWASRDGDAAMAWLREQAADARRDRILARTYRTWLRADEAGATAWLEEHIGDDDLAPAAIAHASALAQDDPDVAIEWVELIPVREVRERARRTIEAAEARRERVRRKGARQR